MTATGSADPRRRATLAVDGRGLVRPPVGRLHLGRRRRLGLVRRQPRRRHGPDAVARPRRRRRAIRWSTARSSTRDGTVAPPRPRRVHRRGHRTDWTSPATGADYPAGWRVAIPGERLSIELTPTVAAQELDTRATTGVIYWEGSQVVRAARGGTAARRRGVRGADGVCADRAEREPGRASPRSLRRERPEIDRRQLDLGGRGERPRRRVERARAARAP